MRDQPAARVLTAPRRLHGIPLAKRRSAGRSPGASSRLPRQRASLTSPFASTAARAQSGMRVATRSDTARTTSSEHPVPLTDLGYRCAFHIGDQSAAESVQQELVVGTLENAVGLRHGAGVTAAAVALENPAQPVAPPTVGAESDALPGTAPRRAAPDRPASCRSSAAAVPQLSSAPAPASIRLSAARVARVRPMPQRISSTSSAIRTTSPGGAWRTPAARASAGSAAMMPRKGRVLAIRVRKPGQQIRQANHRRLPSQTLSPTYKLQTGPAKIAQDCFSSRR